ncbi:MULTISPECIES: sensor histidine kinase [unclassified Mycobacterium]|uniref:sensor histidine kinase n=1 Tax=unclassified Mycobacterium TaxID=2642494 RepID=UPI0029C95097|nr:MULTISPECIES: histidine kinase [unclassified Mycobacterium]
MLRAATTYLRDRIRQRTELIPLGYSWAIVIVTDCAMAMVIVVATVQRPDTDLVVALAASLVAVSPFVLFFVSGIHFNSPLISATALTATAMFLFGTSTPIPGDFAPLSLVLMVGAVGSLASVSGGLLATALATALLGAASAMHRLDGIAMYLSIIAMGWLVGFLLRTQRQLLIRQNEMQAELAEHAATDERRRIAREVHDVIAHSLTVTLLHVTGARRGLQQDRDIDDAVDALCDAERLGRQAMADIRRTVGLLDQGPARIAPEPGIGDIPVLIDDFRQAGLALTFDADGPHDRVSGAVGLALYRIAQESLANIAKHAPASNTAVRLSVSRAAARLTVVNEIPVASTVQAASDGRGLNGMRQRVELLGGAIDIGRVGDDWSVRAELPLTTGRGQ